MNCGPKGLLQRREKVQEQGLRVQNSVVGVVGGGVMGTREARDDGG